MADSNLSGTKSPFLTDVWQMSLSQWLEEEGRGNRGEWDVKWMDDHFLDGKKDERTSPKF